MNREYKIGDLVVAYYNNSIYVGRIIDMEGSSIRIAVTRKGGDFVSLYFGDLQIRPLDEIVNEALVQENSDRYQQFVKELTK